MAFVDPIEELKRQQLIRSLSMNDALCDSLEAGEASYNAGEHSHSGPQKRLGLAEIFSGDTIASAAPQQEEVKKSVSFFSWLLSFFIAQPVETKEDANVVDASSPTRVDFARPKIEGPDYVEKHHMETLARVVKSANDQRKAGNEAYEETNSDVEFIKAILLYVQIREDLMQTNQQGILRKHKDDKIDKEKLLKKIDEVIAQTWKYKWLTPAEYFAALLAVVATIATIGSGGAFAGFAVGAGLLSGAVTGTKAIVKHKQDTLSSEATPIKARTQRQNYDIQADMSQLTDDIKNLPNIHDTLKKFLDGHHNITLRLTQAINK